MKANEPKTYQGIINKKRCIEITKHYDISQNTFDLIVDFVTNNPQGKVECGKSYITLVDGNEVVKYINAPLIDPSVIEGIIWTNAKFTIIPHINVSSSGGGGGWSSGGGSSNNNNNNNNNNNR